MARTWSPCGAAFPGIACIDGKPFTFMGLPNRGDKMKQTSLQVEATRTLFEAAGVRLTLTFCSPLLVNDPEELGRLGHLCHVRRRRNRRQRAQGHPYLD